MSEPSDIQRCAYNILQANVNGNYDYQRHILERGRDVYHWDVILLQEAARSTASLRPDPYGYKRIVCSAKSPEKGRNISTCVYARVTSPFGLPSPVEIICSCTGDAREHHEEHCCTVALDLPDGTRFFITNGYNRSGEKLPAACLTSFLNYSGRHFLGMDANLHHPLWGGSTLVPDFVPPPASRQLAERLGLEMLLLTIPGKPTYQSGQTYSVIDITCVTPDIEHEPAQMLKELMFPKTDHTPIQVRLYLDAVPRLHESWRWNRTNVAALQEELASKIEVLASLPLTTPAQVETCTFELVSMLHHLMWKFVPRTERTYNSRFKVKTEEIDKLEDEVKIARQRTTTAHDAAVQAWGSSQRSRRERERRRRYGRDARERAIWNPFHKARGKWKYLGVMLQKLKDKEFQRQWRSSFEPGSRLGVWGWFRYARLRGKPPQPAVVPDLLCTDATTNETRVYASNQEKVQGFGTNWFTAEGRHAPGDRNTHSNLPPPEAFLRTRPPGPLHPLQKVTEEQLSSKIDKLNDHCAPGGDEIGPVFLKYCKPQLLPFLTILFCVSMELSYFPIVFKRGKIKAVPKPLKIGRAYSDPGMWRPICLLSILGKLLESHLADLLVQVALEQGMLPATQMAARGRSTTSALLYVLEIVKDARVLGLAVSIMSLDQKGAFNHVQLAELLEAFKRKGVPQWLSDMVASYLSDRETTICIPGYESEPIRCGGIPQGSPLSPILFAFFTLALLDNSQEVPDISSEVFGDSIVFKIAYSDDTYIITVGHTLQATKQGLKEEFERCQEWARTSGATFDVAKTELIHFASKHQRNARPMSHFIEGFNDKCEGSSLKILGIIIANDGDGNLTWDPHFKFLREKVASLEKDFKRITHMTYGLNVISSAQVYKIGIRPAILHGMDALLEPSEEPWYLRRPSHPEDLDDVHERLNTDDARDKTYVDRALPNSLYAPDSKRTSWAEQLVDFDNPFLRAAAGGLKGTSHHYLRSELHMEQLDIFAYKSAVATRAKLFGTGVYATIVEAKKRVKTFAQSTRTTSSMALRSQRDLRTNVTSTVSDSMWHHAKQWYHRAEQAMQSPKSVQPMDEADDESYGPEVSAGISQLTQLYGTLAEPDSFSVADSRKRRRRNLHISRIANRWVGAKMTVLHDQWQTRKKAELGRRPIPAALDTSWGSHNLQRYEGLNKAKGACLFQARTEYIGLNQHLREHHVKDIFDAYCRKCHKNYLETVTHILFHCEALNKERFKAFLQAWPDLRFIGERDLAQREFLQKHPAIAAGFILAHFPNEQFDYTREQLYDVFVNPQ